METDGWVTGGRRKMTRTEADIMVLPLQQPRDTPIEYMLRQRPLTMLVRGFV